MEVIPILLGLFSGAAIGMFVTALFAVNAYGRGYEDGREYEIARRWVKK